ncbi:signal recognition particle-docking protein FtsY [Sporohalobacter salinus]|uniref:signal recognition particle-docking protein FtsY n=1 Tax=Sporohalobacter salinus TaxID=1494606 RepID=UPI001960ACB5|nr:signal recognition particle-docking protein FtsY [Sporohalobacter salinus]MBM7623549.1 fused signal recognition particle receptor [Sporohalobacter salinus]
MFKKLFGRKKKEKEKEEKNEAQEQIQEEVVETEDKNTDSGGVFNRFDTHDPEEIEDENRSEDSGEDGFFSRLKSGLSKTRNSFVSQVQNLFTGRSNIDEELYEDLEEILIQADVGVHTTMKLVDELRTIAEEEDIKEPAELHNVFKKQLQDILDRGADDVYDDHRLTILMVVGVNGVGKTTTIGKIALRAKQNKQDVLLAAGDTFRAGAIEQLEAWGNEVGVDIISHEAGADSAAVAYDAVQAAKARDKDLLVVDTAGRLHTQDNLMEELEKVRRIIGREAEGARVEVLLVLDATTGQNAISQAEMFNEAVDVDGIALTKLDGTAKGGIILAVKEELGIPVKLIGVGEDVEDLQDFEPDAFIDALFAG